MVLSTSRLRIPSEHTFSAVRQSGWPELGDQGPPPKECLVGTGPRFLLSLLSRDVSWGQVYTVRKLTYDEATGDQGIDGPKAADGSTLIGEYAVQCHDQA